MKTHTSKKLLIVEDDVLLRDLYIEILTNDGYAVDEAGDGAIGYKKALEGGYDLIILDIMLPKKDGLEILTDLKKHKSKKPNGPIVIMTNLSQEKVVKQCLTLGASYFLIKSTLTPNQVLDEVRIFLSRDSG